MVTLAQFKRKLNLLWRRRRRFNLGQTQSSNYIGSLEFIGRLILLLLLSLLVTRYGAFMG